MLTRFALVAALLPLTACMSPGDAPEAAAPVSSMNAAITTPEGPYLWACTAPEMNAGAGWAFAIVSQPNETGSEVVLQGAGSAGAMPLDRRREAGLDIFVASGTRIEIAPDGSARVTWPGAADAFAGQCQKGDAA